MISCKTRRHAARRSLVGDGLLFGLGISVGVVIGDIGLLKDRGVVLLMVISPRWNTFGDCVCPTGNCI